MSSQANSVSADIDRFGRRHHSRSNCRTAQRECQPILIASDGATAKVSRTSLTPAQCQPILIASDGATMA